MAKTTEDNCGCSANYVKLILGFLVVQAIGLAMLILVGIWMGNYRGGYSWNANNVFNYHPLFMTIGMIYLYGNGN